METTEPFTQKWVKIEPLGGGGQGDTFIVKSVSGEFGRAVLKLLKPQKAHDAKARRRMTQEVAQPKSLRNAEGKVPQVLNSNTEHFEKSGRTTVFRDGTHQRKNFGRDSQSW